MRYKLNSTVFDEYSNQRVQVDVMAAYRNQLSRDELLKPLTHMRSRCDPRAPKMAPSSYIEAQPLPDVLIDLQSQMDDTRAEIKARFGLIKDATGELNREYEQLYRKIDNEKAKHRKRLD